MKKLFSLLALILVLFTISCTKGISAPTDLKISDNIITFTEIEGAKHKGVFVNKDTNKTYNRVIESGISIESLNLEPGLYELYLEISKDNDTCLTEVISFVVEDLNVI